MIVFVHAYKYTSAESSLKQLSHRWFLCYFQLFFFYHSILTLHFLFLNIQKIMWKLNKSIAKELLPTQPVDFPIEPWWGVCLVNFTLEEFKVSLHYPY